VVVYFAGHGFVERGRGYLAPYDVDPDHLDSSGYSMTTLGDVLATRVKAAVEGAAHRRLPLGENHPGDEQ
jgi:uncharacterized caspase-like protein